MRWFSAVQSFPTHYGRELQKMKSSPPSTPDWHPSPGERFPPPLHSNPPLTFDWGPIVHAPTPNLRFFTLEIHIKSKNRARPRLEALRESSFPRPIMFSFDVSPLFPMWPVATPRPPPPPHGMSLHVSMTTQSRFCLVGGNIIRRNNTSKSTDEIEYYLLFVDCLKLT